MSQSWSPELSFIPRRAPYEIRDKAAGERLRTRVQRWLGKLPLCLHAKLDPFRLTNYYDPDSANAWCIEIVPVLNPFQTDWLNEHDESHAMFMAAIDRLFVAMRERFDLVPAVSRKVRRKGVLIQRDWPTGGSHLHFGADVFDMRADWYELTKRFHRNLVMDYANRPYIRWLLAQWSDDVNSRCAVGPHDFGADGRLMRTADQIWMRTVEHQSNIESRFMASSKASYLTFEFRFIDMVRSAAELRAVALIIHGWMEQMRDLAEQGTTVEPTITLADWRAAGSLSKSHSIVKNWLDSISQSDSVREVAEILYRRNYETRLRHGQLC